MAQLLRSPFIQFPIGFDPTPLLTEIQQVGLMHWESHRLTNLRSIPLVHFVESRPQWRPVIDQLPMLKGFLTDWNAPIGESRISVLEPGARVEEHVDVEFYWKHRLRIHIVLQSNPLAEFGCDNQVLSLPAGQVWVSNNWAPHWIENRSDTARIHIVIDTVGSPLIWDWIEGGWSSDSGTPMPTTTQLHKIEYSSAVERPRLEKHRINDIRTPAEVMEIVEDCLLDLAPGLNVATHNICRTNLRRFVIHWRCAYYNFGNSVEGHEQYQKILEETVSSLPNPKLWNGLSLHTVLQTQIGCNLNPESLN